MRNFILEAKTDALACYTALHDGEDSALQRYRTDQDPNFSKAILRSITRPQGVRHLRRLITSYLVHPIRNRTRLSDLQDVF